MVLIELKFKSDGKECILSVLRGVRAEKMSGEYETSIDIIKFYLIECSNWTGAYGVVFDQSTNNCDGSGGGQNQQFIYQSNHNPSHNMSVASILMGIIQYNVPWTLDTVSISHSYLRILSNKSQCTRVRPSQNMTVKKLSRNDDEKHEKSCENPRLKWCKMSIDRQRMRCGIEGDRYVCVRI